MQEDGGGDGGADQVGAGEPAGAGERRERARRGRARRERERRERARRRRAREERCDTAETVGETCELVDSVRACGGGCGRLFRSRGGGGSSGDGGCGCDGPCDLSLVRLSTLLFLAATVAPARGADGPVRAAVRGYQRWLSRFTPRCPGTPSCSAFALDAVESLGVRRGLAAAAARVRDCGMPAGRA